MIFKFGELYCGPGGLSLGAGMALVKKKNGEIFKISHSWANDFDQDACDTYNKNIGKDLAICKDVRKLDIVALPKIDAFAFGFPCNDFSIVGEQNGFNGNFGPLYTYGTKVLNHHNPKWFIAENVGGITSVNEGKAFRKILKSMAGAGNMGYTIVPHLYKFEEYSVPQKRH
ncbi:MAG: DNA (cytosine-5-)-methyltransferase, partial [Gammaproteobacteria bacterium]|nr:DNA (cytosine-5-)-methyltransferase [Gammaproteobacteria bacterium]